MTPFCFEHVFLAAAPSEVFAAYFDSQHQVEQDWVLEIREREVLELVDRGDEIVRRSRIVPRRQVPTLLRPLARGPLHYIEHAVGRRASHTIDIDLRLFGDRGRVAARYELAQMAPGSVRRRYSGVVSVDV